MSFILKVVIIVCVCARERVRVCMWMKIVKNVGNYSIYKAGKGWHDCLNDK